MKKVTSVDERWRRQFIVDLNERWRLSPVQSQVAQAIFRDNKKLVVVQAGRKFGKTTTQLYVLTRAAGTKWAGIYFWFAPRAKQAREIVWASNRLQTFVPKKYVKKILNVEMRVTYYNDSFIKLDGTDEYEQYRGTEADGAGYDEGKDHDHRFDSGFRPNLGPRQGFLLSAGTPPRNAVTPAEKNYFALIEEAKFRSDGLFLHAPSWDRPDPAWQEELARIKAIYEHRAASGDEDAWNEWRCEYGGEYVEGGPGAIIPMFKEARHVRLHSALLNELHYKKHDLEWWCIADPGNNHPFAVSFWALDRATPRVYCLDEIWETDQTENTTGRIHPRIMKKVEELYPFPDLWNFRYDEAALWFKAHLLASGNDPGWIQTNKAAMRAARPDELKPYLDVMKDCIREDVMCWSDRCENFIREIKSYKRLENGQLPKVGQDLLDTGRYFLGSAAFTFYPSGKPRPADGHPSAYTTEPPEPASELETQLVPSLDIGWDFSMW